MNKTARRIQGIDIARGLALLGIVVNHIFYFAHYPTAEALQDYHAVLFMLLAGMVYTYAEGEHPGLKNRVRGISCIILGLVLGSGNPALELILLNYGWTFLIASFFVHKLKRKTLFTLATVWVLVAPILSLFIRTFIKIKDGPNIGFQHLVSEPWLIIADPILFSNYPVFQWFSVFLFGAALGRTNLQEILGSWDKSLRLFQISLASFLIVKGGSVVAGLLAGMTVQQSLDRNFRLAFGNIDPSNPHELLLSGPYTGTTPALVASTAVALAVVALSSMLALRRPLKLVQRLGTATLTLYSMHAFAQTIVPKEWFSQNGILYYMVTVVAMVMVVMIWDKFVIARTSIKAPGPVEAVIGNIVHMETEKRLAGQRSKT